VSIDRKKAGALGVPISQVASALGVYMGSEYVNDFDFNNRSYRVYVQADQPFRMTPRPAPVLRALEYAG
jgi:HAE1 family hydrophobic/amphiphilic exporter-1